MLKEIDHIVVIYVYDIIGLGIYEKAYSIKIMFVILNQFCYTMTVNSIITNSKMENARVLSSIIHMQCNNGVVMVRLPALLQNISDNILSI